jgi:hypothetical protein
MLPHLREAASVRILVLSPTAELGGLTRLVAGQLPGALVCDAGHVRRCAWELARTGTL